MDYVQYSDHPLHVSRITLGTMMFGSKCDSALTEKIVGRAIDAGINSFDTAEMYSSGVSEEYLGRVLRSRSREEIFVTTKVVRGLDRASITDGVKESLKRLQMEYVDQYLIHWPVVGMDLTEMMAALNSVVTNGFARLVGVCNFPAYLVASSNAIAAEHGWARLKTNQVAYNLFERGVEVEILPQAILEDIAIMAYRPLAVGLLTGKFMPGAPMDLTTRGAVDSKVITWLSEYGRSIENFVALAKEIGVEPGHLAVAWVLHTGVVTTSIVGVSSVEQVESIRSMTSLKLSEKVYQQVSDMFVTEVKEEGIQRFPGVRYNFPRLRRTLRVAVKKAIDR